MLSDVFEEEMNEDEDEQSFKKARTGLLVPGMSGWQDKILRMTSVGVRMSLSGLHDSPDEVRHELQQFFWNMIILIITMEGRLGLSGNGAYLEALLGRIL